MRKALVGLSVVLGAFLGSYGALLRHEVISGELKWRVAILAGFVEVGLVPAGLFRFADAPLFSQPV